MSLEQVSASLEEKLVDELSYSLKNGTNYVTRRESVTFFPAGSGGYSPSNVKTVRIPLNQSGGWLDPQTVSFQFTIKSEETSETATDRKRIQLVSGQHSVWGRMRILCGGQTLEDCSNYNRLYDMYLKMAPESYLKNYVVQGPGIQEPFPDKRFQYFGG